MGSEEEAESHGHTFEKSGQLYVPVSARSEVYRVLWLFVEHEYFDLNTDSGLDGLSCAVGAKGAFARFENSKHSQSKASVG